MSAQTPLNSVCDMQQLSVTAGAPTQIPEPRVDSSVHQPERVVVQALSTNSAPIFMKNNIDVAGDGSTGGYELPAGSNIMLPVTDYRDFYLISSSGTQTVQIIFIAG